MMTCKRIRRNLSAFLDGEVTQDEAGRIERHLASCPGCCDEARALTITYQLLECCPRALRPGVRSIQVPAEAPLRRLVTLPIGSFQLDVSRATSLLAVVTGLLVGSLLGLWLWPRLSPTDPSSAVLLDPRGSPSRDAAAFEAPGRGSLEEIYVMLTSGSARSGSGRR
jgi:anti-sigma factor RsiW